MGAGVTEGVAEEDGLVAGVTEAVEEEAEAEAAEVLLGLIGVGVSGRRRLVTSPSGNAASRWRLVAAEEGGDPRGVAALVVGFIGMAAAAGNGRGRGLGSPRFGEGEELPVPLERERELGAQAEEEEGAGIFFLTQHANVPVLN